MKISNWDKIRVIYSLYNVLYLFSGYKKRMSLLFRPFDAPRYVELAYLNKFIVNERLGNLNILDVSSPYVMAYILSKNNKVTKTDIDNEERNFIQENKNLSFKIEDATHLTFSNDTFGLVYSVSVIEHIYEKYIQAIREMIRVTKKNGYVYLTFPISNKFTEEWLPGRVYENQYKGARGTFFQYRFDENHVNEIMKGIVGVEVINKDIFWERTEGDYNVLIDKIRKKMENSYLNFIKDAMVNAWYGFTLFRKYPDQDFKKSKSFGNMHLLLKKIS